MMTPDGARYDSDVTCRECGEIVSGEVVQDWGGSFHPECVYYPVPRVTFVNVPLPFPEA